MPLPKVEQIGNCFDFTMTLQDAQTGNLETITARVLAYDFEQATENLQKRWPQLEPLLDELRIRKAGLDAIDLYNHGNF